MMSILSGLPTWLCWVIGWLLLGLIGKVFAEMSDVIVFRMGRKDYYIRDHTSRVRHVILPLSGLFGFLIVGLVAIWSEKTNIGVLLRNPKKKAAAKK